MIHIFLDIWHWLQEVLGFNAGVPGHTTRWYNGVSGSGSDIGELVLIGSIITLYKHHNCAVPRCPRIAHKKYEVPETKQYVCHRHHTQYWHDLLVKQYKEDYPHQYRLINRKSKKGLQNG